MQRERDGTVQQAVQGDPRGCCQSATLGWFTHGATRTRSRWLGDPRRHGRMVWRWQSCGGAHTRRRWTRTPGIPWGTVSGSCRAGRRSAGSAWACRGRRSRCGPSRRPPAGCWRTRRPMRAACGTRASVKLSAWRGRSGRCWPRLAGSQQLHLCLLVCLRLCLSLASSHAGLLFLVLSLSPPLPMAYILLLLCPSKGPLLSVCRSVFRVSLSLACC
jgi:hypothetical protein